MRRLQLLLFAVMALFFVQRSCADDLLLTLDLRNAYRNDPLSGGIWQLFVRRAESGTEPQGDYGVSGVRALIDNISAEGIAFAAGIGQSTSGGPYVSILSNGSVEIIYQQDLNGTVVGGVGVPVPPVSTRDRLIASGTWPAGPRPVFGMDPEGIMSSGEFLGGDSAPYPPSVPATSVPTSIVTLGDLNNSGTISNLDTALFVARFPGATPSLPYHPAADLNQNGTISSIDIAPYVALLSGPIAPFVFTAIVAVPEPSSFSLLAALGMVGVLSGRKMKR